MTRTRTWALAGSAVLLAAVLVACGGGGGSTNSPPPPPPVTYTVGGSVSGLSGTVVLQNNAGNDLTVSANSSFAFTTALSSGSAYAVTVRTQPSTAALVQNCSVSSGSGSVASANVTNVSVACVTTAINGLTVPPPPGTANDSTIAGIDSDNNGIRDDIDIFIATKYGMNANALKGARIAARADQRVLLADPIQSDQSRIILQDSGDAGVCAGRAFRASGLSSTRELHEIYLRSYNTEERLQQDRRIGASAGLFERSVTAAVCQ